MRNYIEPNYNFENEGPAPRDPVTDWRPARVQPSELPNSTNAEGNSVKDAAAKNKPLEIMARRTNTQSEKQAFGGTARKTVTPYGNQSLGIMAMENATSSEKQPLGVIARKNSTRTEKKQSITTGEKAPDVAETPDEPMARERGHYFHCATKGLTDDVLFSSEKSFIAGMNRIAVCYLMQKVKHPIVVLAFCLMDNHLHFILHGTYDSCNRFMELYKRLTEIWLENHPEEGSQGKEWDIGIWQIANREKLIEKVVYVLRNPMTAGQPYSPTSYRWSSGNLLFSDKGFPLKISILAGSLSLSERRRRFNTRVLIPDEWRILPDDVIWPGCYTEYARVERLFKGVKSFLFELNQKVEDDVNQEMEEEYISLPDGDIREKALALASYMYNKERIADLTVLQRQVVGKELKKLTGTSTKQIARIVRIKYDLLKELI